MSTWTLKEKSTGDLDVTIEGDEWKQAVDKAFHKLAANTTVNGFRKGHAPAKLLEERISAAERQVQAVQDNANEWMRKALEENNLSPISQPQLDIKDINADKVDLVYTFAVMPEVNVSDYKGLKYEVPDTSVSEDEFNAELDRMRETYADLEEKEGEAEKGDTVNIDYEGFKDGEPFDGGKAEGYNLELGSNSFIPGFEDQLIGTKAGDEKELNLKFPDDYHADDLAGKDVVFKVKVNKVTHKVLPEVDDDFAKDVNAPGVETADDLRKMIRDRLESSKKNDAETKADNELTQELLEKIDVDLPDVLIEDEMQNEINQLASQIQQYGMSLTQYLKMIGQTVDDLKKQYQERAAQNVKLRLGLEKIAEKENLEPGEDDINKAYEDIAQQYGMELDKVKSLVSPDLLKEDVRNQKAYDFVKENAAKPEQDEAAEPETKSE